MAEKGAIRMDRENTITEVKNSVLISGFNSLVLVNGGGAIAIAALLKEVWFDWPRNALYLALSAIVFLILGLVSGVLAFWYRYVSFHDKKFLVESHPWRITRRLYMASALLFVVAMILVVVAGYCAIPQ